MKKIYTIATAALLSTTALIGQASFADDFESYTVGQYIGTVSPNWTTWSGANGGTEDTQVNNTMNNTIGGSKSVHYSSTAATGGPQDCVLPFGGQYNTGTFMYSMDIFVTTGQGAYFNFQANTTLGQLWALEVYMPQTGTFYMTNTNGQLLTGTFPLNTWFTMSFDINLNSNVWDAKINGTSVGIFANTVNQIASIDIFPYNGTAVGGNSLSDFYVDNVAYSYTPYTLPTLNGAVTQISGVTSALATQSKQAVVTVRNLGVTAITSYDLTWNYNSGSFTQSYTGSLASLATTTVTMTQAITVAAGSMPLSVTISNVNGNASDGDASDDIKTVTLNPVVPAPNKVVVGEEATGTWCPWCVRGTVYMDYMETNFDGFWAGIAVHNGDPMTEASYDAAIGPLISGYPSLLVDRTPSIDPSQAEAGFMTQVVTPAVGYIVNGAQYNSSTGQLDVSLTYYFTAPANSGYKFACVLTEDNVSGTGSTWSQANAYAGGAQGPMGGFESLPNPVPYSQMQYDHVARAISPSFAGGTGFPTTIAAGYSETRWFTFTVPAGWNIANMHIVGMLIEPGGEINNGSTTTVNEAIANGFVGVNDPAVERPSVQIFPNPATDNTNLSVSLVEAQPVTVTIYDVAGKIVTTRDYGMMQGDYILPINTEAFEAGVYVVELRTGDNVTTQRLVIQ
jgi:hypothetical protein